MDWDQLHWWRQPKARELLTAPGLPAKELRLKAFDRTPFDKVKVVILGQDPYHKQGVANGLAFSVPPGTKIPPTLRNIFTEYVHDLQYPVPSTGDLTPWADRGVLLLNSVLSVDPGKPGSHRGRGWEKLTVECISTLSKLRNKVVFILWGVHANEYKGLVDTKKHLILSSSHPSPMAIRQKNSTFYGSKPFSKASKFLGLPNDMWRLP